MSRGAAAVTNTDDSGILVTTLRVHVMGIVGVMALVLHFLLSLVVISNFVA